MAKQKPPTKEKGGMMLFRKAKRQPIRVVVTLESEDKSTKAFNIDIPLGSKFVMGNSWDNPKLLNQVGEVIKVYDWQAGYTVVYDFQYE